MMAADLLLLTPLSSWNGGAVELAPDLAIRCLDEIERASVTSVSPDGYWLCHGFENPHPPGTGRHKRRREGAFKHILQAMYAIQVLVPSGGMNIVLLLRRSGAGLDCESTDYRQPFLPTPWARRAVVPAGFAAEAPVLFERVLEVFHNPILRLQIPIWLMEQGLVAPDQHIRILLCATGLDSITKASGQAVFKERLSELLGSDTLIFPPDCAGNQPRYRVGEVAGHLYQLRNEMAHGLPFDAMFRKTVGFLDEAGAPISPEFARYRYDKVLEESAVFLLCRVLREVLSSRLVFDLHRLEWCTAALSEQEAE